MKTQRDKNKNRWTERSFVRGQKGKQRKGGMSREQGKNSQEVKDSVVLECGQDHFKLHALKGLFGKPQWLMLLRA